jgi:hypothetical protein
LLRSGKKKSDDDDDDDDEDNNNAKLSLCLTKHHDMKTYWGVEV